MLVYVVTYYYDQEYSEVIGVADSVAAANLLITEDLTYGLGERDRSKFSVSEHTLRAIVPMPTLGDWSK